MLALSRSLDYNFCMLERRCFNEYFAKSENVGGHSRYRLKTATLNDQQEPKIVLGTDEWTLNQARRYAKYCRTAVPTARERIERYIIGYASHYDDIPRKS